jgi:hypothetical protein
MVFSLTLAFLSCTGAVDIIAGLFCWMESCCAFVPRSTLRTMGVYGCHSQRSHVLTLLDRNFRENRFFTPWNRPRYVEQYNLPPALQKHQGVRQVPIGDVIMSLNDTTVAAETCEELFTPQAPHINMYVFSVSNRKLPNLYDGALNSSGLVWLYCTIADYHSGPSTARKSSPTHLALTTH